MKQPNSFGTVSLIDRKSKRRNPYRVQITIGYKMLNTETGDYKQMKVVPIKKTLGYVKTRKEGIQMLADYHNNPYDISGNILTFNELYDMWINYKEKKIKTIKPYTMMKKHYKDIENKAFSKITTKDLQDIIDKNDLTVEYQRKIIGIYSQMHDYAEGNNIRVGADISKYVIYKKGKETAHREVFTSEEINTLWNHRNDVVDILLVLIYTGVRPNELLKITEIHENYFITGSKTESGKDRVIPLNHKIKDIFHKLNDNNILTRYNGTDNLYHAIKKRLKLLNMDHHVPYEARHTFATLCKRAGVDDYSRKLIMGHKITDLTDRVYTHKLIEELIEEVDKI